MAIFDAPLPMKVMLMQVNDPPPPLEGWPRAVERVISSALAKEPHDRPTAADFAHALERALQA